VIVFFPVATPGDRTVTARGRDLSKIANFSFGYRLQAFHR